MLSLKSSQKAKYLAAVSLITVFIIDVFTPTEFVLDVLYLCCLLIVFKQNSRTIIFFSVAACFLIVLNILLAEKNVKLCLSAYVNRGISIFAVFITAYISLHYRKSKQKSLLKEQQYVKDLREMLFITSHKIRKPVANIIGLVDLINSEYKDVPTRDLSEYYNYIQSSSNELDSYVRDLNAFIEDAEQKQY